MVEIQAREQSRLLPGACLGASEVLSFSLESALTIQHGDRLDRQFSRNEEQVGSSLQHPFLLLCSRTSAGAFDCHHPGADSFRSEEGRVHTLQLNDVH